MKKIFLLLLVSFIVFAAGAWLIPDAHADSGAMAYKGAMTMSGQATPYEFDSAGTSGEDTASTIGAAALFILFAVLWLFYQDLKRNAKLKAIKLVMNLLATFIGPVAPEITAFYVVIRFLFMAISLLVRLAKRS